MASHILRCLMAVYRSNLVLKESGRIPSAMRSLHLSICPSTSLSKVSVGRMRRLIKTEIFILRFFQIWLIDAPTVRHIFFIGNGYRTPSPYLSFSFGLLRRRRRFEIRSTFQERPCKSNVGQGGAFALSLSLVEKKRNLAL